MKVRMLFTAVLILVVALLIGVLSMAATPPLVPFECTGDLFVLEGWVEEEDGGDPEVSGCGCILRITPRGVVTIEVTKAEIMAATGEADVSFNGNGIAFDASGAMYFTESESDAILRRAPGGAVTVLTSSAAITATTGSGDADPEGIAFSDDGFLYVNDSKSESVLQVNPTTGAVSEYVSKATLSALGAGLDADLESAIVGAAGGVVYTASEDYDDDGDNTIFRIAPGGIPTILVRDPGDGSVFNDLDESMTRAPNGDLIIADDQGSDTIHRVTPAGVVSTFLSEAQLEGATCVGQEVDLEGGIAFDDAGNFYVAESNTDAIYKFDPTCSTFVISPTIKFVTGVDPDLEGGIAFAPRECLPPEPVGGIVVPVNRLGLLAPWMGLVGLASLAAVAVALVRRRRG